MHANHRTRTDAAPQAPRKVRTAGARYPALPLLLALGVGLLTVDGFFVIDDFFLLNMAEQREPLAAFVYWTQGRDYFDGSWSMLSMKYGRAAASPSETGPFRWYWRPFALLSLMAQRSLFGNLAPAYHLVSVFLHVLCVWALMWWARPLIGSQGARVAGIWFALLPASAETVSWISAQPDQWLALFISLSMGIVVRLVRGTFDLRRRRFAAALVVLGALSLLSKESGVALAPMLCAGALLAAAVPVPGRPVAARRAALRLILTSAGVVSLLSAGQLFYTQYLSLVWEGPHLGIVNWSNGLDAAWMAPYWLQRLCGAVAHLFFWTPVHPGIFPFAEAPEWYARVTAIQCALVGAGFAVVIVVSRRHRWCALALLLLLLFPLAPQLMAGLAPRYLTAASTAAALAVGFAYVGAARAGRTLCARLRGRFDLPVWPVRALLGLLLTFMMLQSAFVYFTYADLGREAESYTRRLIAAVRWHRERTGVKVRRVYLFQRPLFYKVLDESYERAGGPPLQEALMTLTTEMPRRLVDMNPFTGAFARGYCAARPRECAPQRIRISHRDPRSFVVEAIDPPFFTLPLFDLPGLNDARLRRRLYYRDPGLDFSIIEIAVHEPTGLPSRLRVGFRTPLNDPRRLILIDSGKRFHVLGRAPAPAESLPEIALADRRKDIPGKFGSTPPIAP
jgi:hypothetical protein